MTRSHSLLRLGITGAALTAALLVPGTASAETGSAATGSADTLSSAVTDSNIPAMISKAIICLINPQSSQIGQHGGYPICNPQGG